jgi:bifunctional DNase/RNase
MWWAVAITLAWLETAVLAAPVEVRVKAIRLDPDAGSPVLQLVERGGQGRSLPIWIGLFEAQAIAVELEGVAEPRPAAHDLMKAIVSALGGRLDRVVIGRLERDTYLARLELERSGGRRVTVDARPSDAIALALRVRRPIFVESAVFTASGEATGGPTQAFGITAQDLTPDLAEVLASPGVHGAVVTDVDPTSPARKLHRADVITGVDGEAVGSAHDLLAQLERRGDGRPMRVALRRDGRPLEVRVRVAPVSGADR